MPILTADDSRIDAYEDYVRKAPFTSVTQSVEWGRIKNNWGSFYVYLGPIESPRAAMSVLTIDGFAYATKGPVGDRFDVDTLNALVEEAMPELEARNCFLLRLDPEVPFDDDLNARLKADGYVMRNRNLPKEEAHATTQPRFNVVLDIDGVDPDDLIMTFHSKTRYNIRLAGRKGVKVERDETQEAMDEFYHTYEVMSQRHGIAYRPKAYFDRMVQNCAGKGILGIYLARVDSQAIAGALNFEFGDKSWYMYGGSLNIMRNYMAPYLVQWAQIEHAIASGKKRYDFGGIFGFDDSDGLYKFKRGFTHNNEWVEYIGEIDKVLGQERYQAFIKK